MSICADETETTVNVSLDGIETVLALTGLMEGVPAVVSVSFQSAIDMAWDRVRFETTCGCVSLRISPKALSDSTSRACDAELSIRACGEDLLQRIEVRNNRLSGDSKIKSLVVKGAVSLPFACESFDVFTEELVKGEGAKTNSCGRCGGVVTVV